jgi:hypothetical protein
MPFVGTESALVLCHDLPHGLTAYIRKIITALNAMLRDNTPWRSSFA